MSFHFFLTPFCSPQCSPFAIWVAALVFVIVGVILFTVIAILVGVLGLMLLFIPHHEETHSWDKEGEPLLHVILTINLST